MTGSLNARGVANTVNGGASSAGTVSHPAEGFCCACYYEEQLAPLYRMPDRLTHYLPDWIAAHPRRWAAVAAIGLVAALYAWARGGFRDVPPAPLPAYAADATITTNEWTLRPLRAWIADRDPVGRRAPGGGALLVVELWAENRTDRSSTSVTQALRLLGAQEDPDQDPVRQGRTPLLVLLRDPSYSGIVHPGLPERLAAVWDLSPVPVATQAQLRVIGREWVERDSLIGGSGWMRERIVGALTLPLEDRRAAAEAPAMPPSAAPAAPPAPAPGAAPGVGAIRPPIAPAAATP